MNQLLDSRYLEKFQRLALGLEPIDAMRLHRVAHPLTIVVEQPPKAGPRPPVDRHASCLHALRYYPTLVDKVDIRIVENFRRFVPRRFSIPVHTLATADSFPYTDRVRSPFIFPGAAYDLDSCATGIRGRVLRNGQPMRWARVEARWPADSRVLSRAHGDDRGEFLLVIGPNPILMGELVSPISLLVTVFGPGRIPIPATPDLPLLDPLWDLPLEVLPMPGTADNVSTGDTLPSNYTASTASSIDFSVGELHSGLMPFTIT